MNGIVIKRSDFARIGQAARSAVADIVRQHADAVVARAQSLVPVASGALRESIQREPMATGATVATITAFGNRAAGKSYAAFVELGTRRMAAQPFLRPAVEAEIPLLERDLQNLEPRLRAAGTVTPHFESS